MSIENLISFSGAFVLMGIAWLFSADRRRMNWRVIGWGTALQFLVGALVFLIPGSHRLFLALNDAVLRFLEAAQAGQKFLFGNLAEVKSVGFVIATQALPIVIVFSALMGLLYYWRIMPWLIRGFAWIFTRLMRVSGAESLCTASNIFVGIESITSIRPYLARLTRSEFCTILTAGMATVASSTMGLYVLFLKDTFPEIAGHLISASVMSAPAALVMSKILVPESGQPETLGITLVLGRSEDAGWIDAIVNGAMAGAKLVAGICALLVAFLGLLAALDMLVAVGTPAGMVPWSLAHFLGYLFQPLALIMGVPPADAAWAGQVLGQRLTMTEVPAYQALAEALRNGQLVSPQRTAVIVAYALCGFAHIASLAIFAGGTCALAPERRQDITAVGPRALVAATLACLMTGAVAGTFCTPTTVTVLTR